MEALHLLVLRCVILLDTASFMQFMLTAEVEENIQKKNRNTLDECAEQGNLKLYNQTTTTLSINN